MKNRPPHAGFVALMSVILVSAILLIIMFTLGTTSFFTRFDALDMEHKRISRELAEACASVGMLKFAEGDYGGYESRILDASDTNMACAICRVTSSGLIAARAAYKGAYTNLEIDLGNDGGAFFIRSARELPSGPAECAIP